MVSCPGQYCAVGDHSFVSLVSAQFPPRSAARSTMTAPSGMPFTASSCAGQEVCRELPQWLQPHGSRPPCLSSSRCLWVALRSSAWHSRPCPRHPQYRGRVRGSPQAFDLLLHGGPNVIAWTTPPRRRAVAMACSPATPAPMIKTRAGDIVLLPS